MHCSIDDQNNACDPVRIKIYQLHLVFDLRMIFWRWIYCCFIITKTDRRVDQPFVYYSKIETLFGKYKSFCWSLRLIIFWCIGKQWTVWCWAYGPTFWGKTFGCWIVFLKGNTICVKNRTYVENTKEKQDILIWNWALKN